MAQLLSYGSRVAYRLSRKRAYRRARFLPEGIHWPRYATPPKVISPFLGVAYRPDGMPHLRVQIIANSIGMPFQRGYA